MEEKLSLKEFCRNLPKVELHAHITGSVKDDFLMELLNRRKRKDPNFEASAAEEIIKRPSSRTMIECFTLFRAIQSLIIDLETVYEVTRKVISDFAADGVRYLELRTTPRQPTNGAFTREEHISCILRAIHDSEMAALGPTAVRLLISIDRHYGAEVALEIVNLAKKLRDSHEFGHYVVGIDLSGDPYVGSHADFVPALQLAKSLGFKLAIHIAEIKNINDETLALLSTHPQRLGHGTFMHADLGGSPEIFQQVTAQKIPIEVCLTSNLKTESVSSFEDHHLKLWQTIGQPIIICSDDMGVFQSMLSEELEIASKTFGFTPEEMTLMTYNAMDYSFCEETVKSKLKLEIKQWAQCHFPQLHF